MSMRFFRTVRLIFVLLALAMLSACEKPEPNDVRALLQKKNPDWKGEFMTGYYAFETPLFEFSENRNFNAVAISGEHLRDFSPLDGIPFRILSLRNLDISSLSFMENFHWESEAILEIQQCRNLIDFKALKTIPLSTVSIQDTPHFMETSLFGEKLKSIFLAKTGVKKLEFRNPDKIEEFQFVGTGATDLDLTQIGKMPRLANLLLDNVHDLSNISFSNLEYLEKFTLVKSNTAVFPTLSPRIMRNIWIEDCPNLQSLDSLSGKVIDRLCIMRSGDPGKLLANLTNTKINLLVVNGTKVTNIAFLKRIKDLNCVRFQNCTGLPENINEPFVEVIVEDI